MDLNIKKATLEDRDLIEPFFWMNRTRSCEYTFANLYLWSGHYKVGYAMVGKMLVFQYTDEQVFTFPLGDHAYLKETIDLLIGWAKERGIEFKITNVTPEQFALLEEIYPGRFEIEYYRDSADYIYETEKLINLSGKKYHGKKNHINKFKKMNPDWSYESITKDNVEDCFQMALEWRNKNGCEEDEEKSAEICVTLNSLRLFEELKLRGGLIRAGGRVVAFTIGEPVCDDTMVIHIEKAFADVQGAYPIINQQFLAHEATEYKYVNREEDLGEEGLRKAKESYHPVFLQEKGVATLRQ